MKRFLLSFSALMVSIAGLLTLPVSASAQTIAFKGLSITPALQQLSIKPTEKSVSYKIRIDNNQASPVKVDITSLDFKSLNETGGLAFIGNKGSELEHQHGLAKWLELPSSINLPANGGKFITVTVQNRQDLAAGGHYAAILFSVGGNASAGNRVRVDQVISSLLFVSKLGGETYSLELKKTSFSSGWFGWPSQANLYFLNSGNTQTAPHGTLQFRGNDQVINPDSNLVLPGSTRKYNVNLKANKPFWPWVYRAQIKYHAGNSDSYKTANVGFVYINPWFLLLPAALIAWLLAAKPRLRRLLWRWFVRLMRFIRRLFRVVKLFFVVYLPYRYRKYQKAKRSKNLARSAPAKDKKTARK